MATQKMKKGSDMARCELVDAVVRMRMPYHLPMAASQESMRAVQRMFQQLNKSY